MGVQWILTTVRLSSDHRRMRLIALVLILIALCSGSALAEDQDKNKDRQLAEQHYNAGKEAFTEGRFSTAMLEFGLAYELSKEPLLLADLAHVAEKMGRSDVALAYSRQFLERATNDTPQDALEEARQRVARLSKEVEPKQAPAPSAPLVPASRATPPRAPANAKKIAAIALVVVGGVGLIAALGTGIGGGVVSRQVEGAPLTYPEYQALDARGTALNAGFAVSLAIGISAAAGGSVWLGLQSRH